MRVIFRLLPRGGNAISTIHLPLAEKVLVDIENLKTDIETVSGSGYSWLCVYLDKYEKMTTEEIQRELLKDFPLNGDWSFIDRRSLAWVQFAGSIQRRTPEILLWLKKCSALQLTAVKCICDCCHSINIAFILAKIIEEHRSERRTNGICKIAKYVSQDTINGTLEKIENNFALFELFYGLDVETNKRNTAECKDVDIKQHDVI